MVSENGAASCNSVFVFYRVYGTFSEQRIVKSAELAGGACVQP